MNRLYLIARITRSHYALAAGIAVAATTAGWVSSLPSAAIQPAVTSLAPVFAIVALLAVLTASLGAVPKHESLDATGRRTAAAGVRAMTIITVTATPAIAAIAIAAAAGSPWHLLPFLNAGLLVGAVTLTLTSIAPAAVATLPGSAYVFICFIAGRGDHWWDQIYRPADQTRITLTAALALAAALTYLWAGARPTHQYEEIF